MPVPLDEYPIHQTPLSMQHVGTSDRNFYDRYFFNGYSRDGSLYFGAALGLYPNRKVMDAAFAVLRDGEEVSVIASRRAPLDPTETRVGPISPASCLVMWMIAAFVMLYTPSPPSARNPPTEAMLMMTPGLSRIACSQAAWLQNSGPRKFT